MIDQNKLVVAFKDKGNKAGSGDKFEAKSVSHKHAYHKQRGENDTNYLFSHGLTFLCNEFPDLCRYCFCFIVIDKAAVGVFGHRGNKMIPVVGWILYLEVCYATASLVQFICHRSAFYVNDYCASFPSLITVVAAHYYCVCSFHRLPNCLVLADHTD